MHEGMGLETTRERKVAFVASCFPLLCFVSGHKFYLTLWIISLFLSESTHSKLSFLAIQSKFILKIRIDEDLMKKKKEKDEK